MNTAINKISNGFFTIFPLAQNFERHFSKYSVIASEEIRLKRRIKFKSPQKDETILLEASYRYLEYTSSHHNTPLPEVADEQVNR